jgi:two-component system sensor kinase FixL
MSADGIISPQTLKAMQRRALLAVLLLVILALCNAVEFYFQTQTLQSGLALEEGSTTLRSRIIESIRDIRRTQKTVSPQLSLGPTRPEAMEASQAIRHYLNQIRVRTNHPMDRLSPAHGLYQSITRPPYAINMHLARLDATLNNYAMQPDDAGRYNRLLTESEVTLTQLNAIIGLASRQNVQFLQTLQGLNMLHLFGNFLMLALAGFFVFKPVLDVLQKQTSEVSRTNKLLFSERQDRLRVQDALRQTRDQYRSVVDYALDGVITVSESGLIDLSNPAVERMFGYARQDLQGKNVSMILPMLFPEVINLHVERYLNQNAPDAELATRGATCEILGRRKDGSTFPLLVSVGEWRTQNQRYYTGILHDISAQKKTEQELKLLTQQLKASNQDLEHFALVTSHDLQEPVRKILAFSERLRNAMGNHLPEQAEMSLSRIESSSIRMRNLINDLLTYSRLNTRIHPFTKVDLNRVLRDVLEEVTEQPAARQPKFIIEPLPTIDADPSQMKQLLKNLISNAVKFQPKTQHTPVVQISGWIEQTDKPEQPTEDTVPKCVIAIRDNGIGFDEQYSDKIFQIFQRLHSKEAYDGTGIGLSICRKIVERHRGALKAASQQGRGSEFQVILPLYQPQGENIA